MAEPTLRFLGGTGSVTGSKFLLESGGTRVLIDCGLFQGLKELRQRNWEPLPVPPAEIDAVVLTHAHIDHSGYLPRLVKGGFEGPIFCTPATRELLGLLLPDCGYLQEEEARYANKEGYSKHKPALPLYTKEDAQHTLTHLRTLDFDKEAEIVRGIRGSFHPTGHILGAAFAVLDFAGRRLAVSGDLGGYDKDLMRGPAPLPKGVDFVLAESTYGRKRGDDPSVPEQLRAAMVPVLERGGVVVIPAFAVGRTSVILFHLRRMQDRGEFPDVPVIVDSPMAVDSAKIYQRFCHEHNLRPEDIAGAGCLLNPRQIRFVRKPEESKKLNETGGPAVIISASGMMTGGRILHHVRARAGEPGNMILLVGYQAEGTRGRALLEGKRELKMFGEPVPVKAQIASIQGMSAHGDSDDVVAWLRTADPAPKKVFLVHGEAEGLRAMSERIVSELGFACHTPKYLETVEL